MCASSIETPIQKINKEKIMIMSLDWLIHVRNSAAELMIYSEQNSISSQ